MKNKKAVLEFSKSIGFEVVGKLKRLPDAGGESPYPLWIDEAGNEYLGSYSEKGGCCIITVDGGVI